MASQLSSAVRRIPTDRDLERACGRDELVSSVFLIALKPNGLNRARRKPAV